MNLNDQSRDELKQALGVTTLEGVVLADAKAGITYTFYNGAWVKVGMPLGEMPKLEHIAPINVSQLLDDIKNHKPISDISYALVCENAKTGARIEIARAARASIDQTQIILQQVTVPSSIDVEPQPQEFVPLEPGDNTKTDSSQG